MKIALYPGSFNPITNGHVWVAEQACKIFDKVIFGIATNPQKKETPTNIELRKSMIRYSTLHLNNVEIIAYDKDLTVDIANKYDCKYIIRGIRDTFDYNYEQKLNNINRTLNSDLLSIFIMPDTNLANVSSSFIREMLHFNRWEEIVLNYITPFVHNRLLVEEKNYMLNKLQEASIFLTDNNFEYYNFLNSLIFTVSDRPYHNLHHVYTMIKELDLLFKDKLDKSDYYKIIFASFIHDLCLDPYKKSGENEYDSYIAYQTFYSKAIPKTLDYEIKHLILDTTHIKQSQTDNGLILQDLDLLQFGVDWDTFIQYNNLIRQEYYKTTDDEFILGRINFLKKILKKDMIYSTVPMIEKYENKARQNITRYLQLNKKI